MEDLATIYKIYKADRYLKPWSVVLDLGSGDGEFSDWAERHGARVHRVDIRGGKKTLPVAVGKVMGCGVVDGEGTGTHILYGGGKTPIITLQALLEFIGRVDVIKCDIEGSEYEIFSDADLSNIQYIAIEFHVWTEPGMPTVDGLGVRSGAMPEDAVMNLIVSLSKTHNVEVVGDVKAGGYLYATMIKRAYRLKLE
jgi:hypothetical protein